MRQRPKILAFDIFGTVVDWHGSIVREMQVLYPQVDGNAFALACGLPASHAAGAFRRVGLGSH
jgi:FMN phosphatase YigB (HAD superfamily)